MDSLHPGSPAGGQEFFDALQVNRPSALRAVGEGVRGDERALRIPVGDGFFQHRGYALRGAVTQGAPEDAGGLAKGAVVKTSAADFDRGEEPEFKGMLGMIERAGGFAGPG